MSSTEQSVLQRLVSPQTVEEFLREYWPDRPFVARGDPARLPAVFATPELSSLEALAQKYNGNILFTNGRKCQKMIMINAVNPALLFEMGLTLQFEDVEPYVPGAAAFLRQLERELGIHDGSLSMSAFVSPASDGLSCHYDAHDVISVQLLGNKRFHIAPMGEIRYPYGSQYVTGTQPYEELYLQACDGFPDSARAEFTVIDMAPGTVLYLPRGTWHYTDAVGASLSVSIMINPPAAVDCLLEQLRCLLLQDARWRRPMYGACAYGATYRTALALAGELLAGLPRVTARLSPEGLLRAMWSEQKRLEAIEPKTRFQRQPNAQVHFPATSPTDRANLRAAEIRQYSPGAGVQTTARMEVFAEAVPVFEWLNGQSRPFTAEALQRAFPAFPFEELKKILYVSSRAQLLKLLWFVPLDGEPEPVAAAVDGS